MNVGRAVTMMGGCVLVVGLVIAADLLPETGSVEGRIIFSSEVPRSSMPDDSGVRDPVIDVDPKTKGVCNVAVYMTSNAMPRAESYQSSPKKMDQVNNRFVPRVLAVRAGQPVIFTNSDAGNHNVRTSSGVGTNEFNIFTGIEGSYRRTFAADLDGQPVRVGCDIHPWMRGWIYVFDHPFFAVTDNAGQFKISGLPPGKYRLVLAQPDIGYRETKQITVRVGETLTLNMEAKVQR